MMVFYASAFHKIPLHDQHCVYFLFFLVLNLSSFFLCIFYSIFFEQSCIHVLSVYLDHP